MKNFLNYAKNRLLYNLIRFIILFILIYIFSQFAFTLKVNADSYNYNQFTAQLYDNFGPTLSSVTTEFVTNRYQGIIPNMTANSSGAAWGIGSPVPLIANHTYTMSITVDGTYGGNIVLSTYNRIGVGTSLGNAVTSYQNNTNVNEIYSKQLNDGMTLQFAFTPSINSTYIIFPFATSSSGGPWSFNVSNIIIDDLGSTGVTETEINNSLNLQTNTINSSIQNSTNTITGAIGDTETSINNNINDMGESINDNINNNFQSCGPANKNLIDFKTFVSGYPSTSGELTNTVGVVGCRRTPNLIKVKPNTTYTFSIKSTTTDFEKWIGVAFYKSNATSTFIKRVSTSSNTFTFTTTSDTNYIAIGGHNITGATQVQLELGSSSTSYVEYQEECSNKIDATNDKLDDLNSSINNESMPNTPDFSGLEMADDTPISDLVLMPINYLNKLVNAFSSTCKTYVLDFGIFGSDYNLSLPCIKPEKWLGSNVWNIVDVFACFFMIYEIGMLAVSIFNDFTSMRDTYDSLYTPKHAKPLGKHTSEVE